MASRLQTVGYLVDQMSDAGEVTVRKMFGEYTVYCGGKVVAVICDDRLFVKLTPTGRNFTGPVPEAPPYPGAKPCLVIDPTEVGRQRLALDAYTAHIRCLAGTQEEGPEV